MIWCSGSGSAFWPLPRICLQTKTLSHQDQRHRISSGHLRPKTAIKFSLCFWLLAILGLLQAGCVSVTPKPEVVQSLEITVPKSWRPLFDADLDSATEAAVIRHYALKPE